MKLMALATSTLVLAAGELPAACLNTIVEEVFAPGQRLKAALYVRQCDAAPTKEVHLSILPFTATLPDERGNTFVGEAPGLDPLDPKRIGVSLTWLSQAELSILHGPFMVRKAAGKVGGVKLYYGHLVDTPPETWRKP
ncbi:MAG: hypothetical protein ACREAA_19385 [Candidatus Polarisedimenticolia bacterium]